ncbi:hypothetical protein D0T53_12595 [Dysgonomonas sp. 216]|nr:hypothetical protein [Dysgonomonas sp. 216]
MAFSSDKGDIKKPKLPRKRKKAAIKVQGRKWYHDTIKLYKITCRNKMFYEPICKFWVNSEVRQQPHVFDKDKVKLVPTPTKYW